MAIDLETLLAPVSDEARAGPDLAYDPQRHVIEEAFEASVSIDASGIADPRSDTDWRQILDTIAALSARTKDVWLAVYLCRAAAEAGRLDQIELGVEFLAGLLDGYWEDMHPRLDEYGIEARRSAFDALASAPKFASPLRRVVYADHPRLGRITGEDIERFHRGGDSEDGYGLFRAMLEDGEVRQALSDGMVRIERIETAFRAIDETLMERAGSRNATDFTPLYDVLGAQKRALRNFAPAAVLETAEPVAEGDADAMGERGATQLTSGTARTREDVVRLLELVLDYYRRHEPSSPVPMLIERACSWIRLDFMAVLEDIAPSAVGDARTILRLRGQ